MSAAAERLLSARHRDAWGPRLYAYDQDTARAEGRFVIVEAPAGASVVQVEYKSIADGPLDLSDLQYRALGQAAHPHVPFVVAQFTSPLDAGPWCFRLHPASTSALEVLGGQSWILTERRYVQTLYVMRHGFTAPGDEGYGLDEADRHLRALRQAGDEGTPNRYPGMCFRCGVLVQERRGVRLPRPSGRGWYVAHQRCTPGLVSGRDAGAPRPFGLTLADDFAHLDDVIPGVTWPEVTLPRAGWAPEPARPKVAAVRRFLDLYAQPDERPVASVVRLTIDRPAVGAFLTRQPQAATVAAVAHAPEASAVLDASDRRAWRVRKMEEAMWASELASDDNRSMYR